MNTETMSPSVPVTHPSLGEAFDLAAVAAGLGQSGIARVVPAGDKRRWSYVIETEEYEAVVIAWPHGAGLRMHDHGDSRAAIHVINGELRERYIDADGNVQVRWLHAGETYRLDATHRHEVINLHDDEVVSVHVYSPPIADKSFRVDQEIDITRSRRETREWNSSETGERS